MTDDPIDPCSHGAACPGCVIAVCENEIPHPHSHGVSVAGPVNADNRTRVQLRGNSVSHVRGLGLFVARPDQPYSAQVELRDNLLTDTGEQRVLSFPGLRACLAANRCSRNVTGKRYELQAFFRCEQCNLVPGNNLVKRSPSAVSHAFLNPRSQGSLCCLR